MATVFARLEKRKARPITTDRFERILAYASAVLLVAVVFAIARTHRIEAHRGAVRGLVLGALLVAGFFTFPFNRLLGHWLFG